MKKILSLLFAAILVFAALFTISCGNEQDIATKEPQKETTSETDGDEFIGAVIKERHKDGRVKRAVYYRPDGTVNFEYEYNEKGQKTKASYYNEDGSLKEYSEYDYNMDGFMVKYSNYDGNGVLLSIGELAGKARHEKQKKLTFYYADGQIAGISEYNENGCIVSETKYDTDGTISRRREFLGTYYDGEPRMTEDILYGFDGEITYHHKYEYDANGRIIKDTAIPGAALTYEYDENGNEIRRNTVLSDGTIKEYHIIEYTADGRKESRYKSGVLLNTSEYSGKKGNDHLVSYIAYSYIGDRMSSYTIVLYDVTGKKARETNYNTDGTERGFITYEYNAEGFLTVMREFRAGGIPKYVTEYPGKEKGENYTRRTEYNANGTVHFVYENK